MTQMPRSSHHNVFDPLPAKELESSRTGIRKVFEKSESYPLRWPQDTKLRYELFDAWHDVAMQIVHRNKASFRLMAVTKKVINWKSGNIKLSNSDLASRAGACSEKTISRDVQDYVSFGILRMEMGWRRSGSQIFRTRTLRPALPMNLGDGIILPSAANFDLDTSCPDGSDIDLDNSGPGDLDNSGPITIETTDKAEPRGKPCS